MLSLPTPHGDKLKALLENGNLPRVDKPRVEAAIDRYEKWLEELRAIKGEYEDVVSKMVSLLNTYKTYLEVDLIFDSSEDFLYRQKGQLKLDPGRAFPKGLQGRRRDRAGKRVCGPGHRSSPGWTSRPCSLKSGPG